MSAASLADRIDALLPQTQCTRCGYPACRPYAEAIAAGAADINRCPPGGAATIDALAALTGRRQPRSTHRAAAEGPLAFAREIDEAACIGCTLCIEACPVDAIIGAAEADARGAWRRCAPAASSASPPCPVDCITLRPAARAWTPTDAGAARERYVARSRRLARDERPADRAASPRAADAARPRKAAVDAALARARARRAGAGVKP